MLTWNVTYTCKPGKRAAFYQALCALGIRDSSRAEAEDDLLLVESWDSPAHQQAHCETESFGKLQALKAEYCSGVRIDKFSR